MKFEHLLHINEPLDTINTLVAPLTHAQLWRGLVLRARSPELFVPWLDGCELTVLSPTAFKRILHYGEVKIHDSVTLFPEQKILYEVQPQGDIPASQLTVTIETPAHELLDVRFSYDNGVEEIPDSAEAFYDQYRRSAYQESDIDTIRMIRQLASELCLELPV